MAPPLSRFRFPVERSRGRRYPELSHPYRNDFQRDRDRIIHTRAFRRLENKTQVFAPSLSDHFRNRLTHTIEVTQIARTVARTLGLNEDLTEALALVHDIGHPPFAHAGEEELDRQMQRHDERFDHNLHALRLVDSFEQRYARFPGLNLTFEVREGMVKHSRDFGPGDFPELDEYLPGLRPPLEAQLIDPSDEVAYNTADLDDAWSAGLFTMPDAGADIPRYGEILETMEGHFPGASDRVLFLETLRALIDYLVAGLIAGTAEAVEAAGLASVDDVREYPQRQARFSAGAQETNAALKTFLHSHVYTSPALVAERNRSRALIERLFELFLRRLDLLPPTYQRETEATPPHRVVCDYLAGMTDGYLLRTAENLLD